MFPSLSGGISGKSRDASRPLHKKIPPCTRQSGTEKRPPQTKRVQALRHLPSLRRVLILVRGKKKERTRFVLLFCVQKQSEHRSDSDFTTKSLDTITDRHSWIPLF